MDLINKVSTFRRPQHLPLYLAFKEIFIQEYGQDILDFDLEIPASLYEQALNSRKGYLFENLQELDEKIADVYSLGDLTSRKKANVALNKFLIDVGPMLDEQVKKLIKRYFSFTNSSPITKTEAEREVNVIIHGYKGIARLPKSILYETLQKNKEEFSETQYDLLMCYHFGKMKKKDFKSKYPYPIDKSALLPNILLKLEKLYFSLPKPLTYNFTKKKYTSIREMCLEKGLTAQVEILDLFFGIETNPHSIEDLASKLHISYLSAHRLVRNAREKCLTIFTISSKR